MNMNEETVFPDTGAYVQTEKAAPAQSGELPREFPVTPLPDSAATDSLPVSSLSFDTAQEARNYILRYPYGSYTSAAETALNEFDHAAWLDATSTDTAAAYQDYMKLFYDGKYIQDAKQRFTALKAQPDTQSCQDFLDSGFGEGATPGSFLAEMRDQKKAEACGEGS